MSKGAGSIRFFVILVALTTLLGACAQQSSDDGSSCTPNLPPVNQVTGSTGSALVFVPDPRLAANDPNVGPGSDLDPYRTRVELSRLNGTGGLQGQYVDVRTNQNSASGACDEQYGALTTDNRFEYSHGDPHFQEAMAYYYGDSYQSALDDAGVEVASAPIHVVAHCEQRDNAFYSVIRNSDGTTEEQVCLGDSVQTPGASYADDAYITVHEMQHATTIRHYSFTTWLDEFPYDEAGSLNEGISDFMALMYLSPLVPSGFNPEIFSSWALGSFFRGLGQERGATSCPMYDSDFANGCEAPAPCDGSDCKTFSADQSHVSFVYPDGLDWPYTDVRRGQGVTAMNAAYLGWGRINPPEEKHAQATIVEGVLWDIYSELLSNHRGNHLWTQQQMMRLVAKTLEFLPKPDSLNLSPVTFREFGSALVRVARALALSSKDQSTIQSKLKLRGLIDGKQVADGWASAGSGGIRIDDNPQALKFGLMDRNQSPSLVQQSVGNHELHPGGVAVIWFDLQNSDAVSAGGVTLTAHSLDSEVSFIPGANAGYISDSEVQTQYSKINGTAIVHAISSGSQGVGALNTYFGSVPEYEHSSDQEVSFFTGIWVKVSPSAAHGQKVRFEVDAQPSNGALARRVKFDATIQ